MGVFAETNFEITCKNKTSALKVKQELKEMMKVSDENRNFKFEMIEKHSNTIYGKLSSGRIQNLEWQCEQIWERIAKIKGIKEANFPFMVEDNGCFFTNEE